MPRYFTLEEAISLLPRLTDILTRVVERKRELDRLQQELTELLARAAGNGHVVEAEATERQTAMGRLAQELEALVDEVSQLGCELKDMELGLVDFPTLRDGREVYLCWRLGESTIAYWHDQEAGYTGRQPL